MVELGAADAPGVLCLQELPVWSFPFLDDWSGMVGVADVAARPLFGAEVGRVITDLNHGLFRSAFTGQGNAILLGPGLDLLEHRIVRLNPWGFRRAQARRLGLRVGEELHWGKERRICQVLRIRRGDSTLVVANLHATGHHDKRIPDAELLRAATFVDGVAGTDEPVVLAGDFNLTVQNSLVLRRLLEREWGFEGAGPGIDHILVRGIGAGPPQAWPVEQRTVGGRVLSDHAPVERRLA